MSQRFTLEFFCPPPKFNSRLDGRLGSYNLSHTNVFSDCRKQLGLRGHRTPLIHTGGIGKFGDEMIDRLLIHTSGFHRGNSCCTKPFRMFAGRRSMGRFRIALDETGPDRGQSCYRVLKFRIVQSN